jgi:hypothetical protein
VKLITDRPSSNYNRSGRTDKGVSALGNVRWSTDRLRAHAVVGARADADPCAQQVISVQVRSNLTPTNPIDENGAKAVIYAVTPLDTSDPRKGARVHCRVCHARA